jgi:chemotaxis protein histidine kinase CheA
VANGVEVVPYREGDIAGDKAGELFGVPSGADAKMCLLVIASERGSVGLVAEKVIGQREVVVSALRDPLIRCRGSVGRQNLGTESRC